jgi:hypothetical protein
MREPKAPGFGGVWFAGLSSKGIVDGGPWWIAGTGHSADESTVAPQDGGPLQTSAMVTTLICIRSSSVSSSHRATGGSVPKEHSCRGEPPGSSEIDWAAGGFIAAEIEV